MKSKQQLKFDFPEPLEMTEPERCFIHLSPDQKINLRANTWPAGTTPHPFPFSSWNWRYQPLGGDLRYIHELNFRTYQWSMNANHGGRQRQGIFKHDQRKCKDVHFPAEYRPKSRRELS